VGEGSREGRERERVDGGRKKELRNGPFVTVTQQLDALIHLICINNLTENI
jgi:hypothetical protein